MKLPLQSLYSFRIQVRYQVQLQLGRGVSAVETRNRRHVVHSGATEDELLLLLILLLIVEK